jgi:hypothetical protein
MVSKGMTTEEAGVAGVSAEEAGVTDAAAFFSGKNTCGWS